MTTFIPAGVLTDLKTLVNRSLNDTATITRSAAVLPCSVEVETREVHVSGVPEIIRIPRWKLAFQTGVDVRPGDVATVATMGTYAILEVLNPRSNAASTLCHAVCTAQVGAPNAVAFATHLVTFQRLKATGAGYDTLANCGVYIEERSIEPQMQAFGALVEWRVYFQNSLTINGVPIGADDQMVWTGAHRGFSVLERPQQLYGPLPYAVAVFREGA